MGLSQRSKRRSFCLGDPAPTSSTARIVFPLIFALALGMGIFWLTASPAQAVTTTSTSVPAGSTATTIMPTSPEAQAQLDALDAQVKAVQTEIDALNSELDQNIQDYYTCLSDLDAANTHLSELRRLVADAQSKKAAAQAVLAARVKAVYISGGRDQLLQLLLLSSSLQDLYNRMRLVSILSDQDNQIVSDLTNSSSRLDLLMKATDGQRREQLALRSRLSGQTSRLQATVDQKQQLLAGLNDNVKAVLEREHQRQLAEQARLEAERQARLLEEQAAAQAALVNGERSKPRGINKLKPVEIAYVAQKAGFEGRNLIIAVAVALAESGGNANAQGDVAIGGSFGLWQVYCMAHPDLIPPTRPDSVAWYDPYQNAKWAYKISGGSNWQPWSTYKHDTYKSYMDVARAAVISLITDPAALTSSDASPTAAD